MTSQSTRVEMLPNHLQGAVPSCFREEVCDYVQHELDPVTDRVLLVLPRGCIKGPVYEHGAAYHVGARNESPIAAVFAYVAIVAHAKVGVWRHNDLAALDMRTHGKNPLLGQLHLGQWRELGKVIAVSGELVLGPIR